MQKNLVIQAMRGIAALAVVVFHCSALLDVASLETRGRVYGPLASGGVDLFFLISGYIIASSVARTNHGLKSSATFLLKRLIRIWPPYAIATAIFCVAFALKNPSAPSVSDVTRSLMFIQIDSAAPYYGFAALVVGWTLNYEMFFYSVVAVAIATRYRWAASVAVFALLLVALPLWQKPDLTIVSLIDADRADANSWVFSNPLNWLFLVGVTVHYAEKKNLTVNNAIVAALLIAVSLAFLTVCYLSPEMNKHGLTGMGLAVIPIFAVSVLGRMHLERFIPRSLVYMGDISFAVYLTHVITLSLVKAALVPVLGENAFLMSAAVLGSIVGGAIYFSAIERPLTRTFNVLVNGRLITRALT